VIIGYEEHYYQLRATMRSGSGTARVWWNAGWRLSNREAQRSPRMKDFRLQPRDLKAVRDLQWQLFSVFVCPCALKHLNFVKPKKRRKP